MTSTVNAVIGVLIGYMKRKLQEAGSHKSPAVGYSRHKQVFSTEQEKQLMDSLNTASDMNCGLSHKEVRKIAFQCAVQFNCTYPESWKTSEMAGKDWMTSFLKRHPTLSIKKPQATSLAGASSVNEGNQKPKHVRGGQGTTHHVNYIQLALIFVVPQVSADAVTLQLLREARETVRRSPLGVINTPMIPWCQTTLPLSISCNIHLKLENMQRTGSFKIRGVANQFARRERGGHFVTMSAGNYGKSFAYASKHYGSKGKVVMPETAPISRSILIQSFGVEVERMPTSCLMNVVNRCVQQENMTFLHSYNDLDLIAGHASVGMEVLEVVPEPDVVVVGCGGGGLLAGVAAAIKLSGCSRTRIYGVEPEGACTMYRSFIEKRPVGMDTKSIASGLAPPFAGTLTYELCQHYVEEVVLVSDEEIRAAVGSLYGSDLVVEPSGAAAFAAIANKIPDLEGRSAVCILSGGNIGRDELINFPG
ncbi:phenylserine dehydratase [Lampris incognitus]|uniref:phenylserine dehydratase n=1 Tax=Lampris incognitus TaxID=2546036 RepID=UPI0024B5675C|nr:phenylserine dehydratase [Lampris incognitus]